MTTTTDFVKGPSYDIYKPLPKENAGAALKISYDKKKRCVFLEITQQNGPKLEIGDKKQFDWSKKIVMKLGEVDISNILLVLRLQKSEAKLFHTNEDKTKSSTLNFKKQTGNYDNYALHVGKSDKNVENSKQSVSIYIDHHEALNLEIFFRKALEGCLGF